MQTIERMRVVEPTPEAGPMTGVLPVSVIVPVRNEARNLPRCLHDLCAPGASNLDGIVSALRIDDVNLSNIF